MRELDLNLFRAVHLGWHREWLDPIFWVITSTGLGWVQVLLLIAAILVQAGIRSEPLRAAFAVARLKQWPAQVFVAWIVAGVLNTGVLKSSIPRDRPSRLAIADPQEGFFSGSFPSGHSATSFGIAFTLVLLTWRTERAWIGLAATAWACLVGLSRVYRGVHWPSDVLGAAFVGAFAASLAVWTLGAIREKAPSSASQEDEPNRPMARNLS